MIVLSSAVSAPSEGPSGSTEKFPHHIQIQAYLGIKFRPNNDETRRALGLSESAGPSPVRHMLVVACSPESWASDRNRFLSRELIVCVRGREKDQSDE